MSKTRPQLHPMVHPRPPVAFGLFGVSLAGVGVMLWGIDHEHISVVIIGWTLATLTAALTVSIYYPEIKQLRNFRTLRRDVKSEVIVALFIISVSVALPPYLFSLRDRSSRIEYLNDVIVTNFDSDNPFYINTPLQNVGEVSALTVQKSFKFVPSDHILTKQEEDDIMNNVKENMSVNDISGIADETYPHQIVISSSSKNMSRDEYKKIIKGDEKLYFFVYLIYVDKKIKYGDLRVSEKCEYYFKTFHLGNPCHGHNTIYTRD